MPSSTSNFKRILRLPRLFFRKPTPSESVHGGPPLEYERPIPPIPWRGITVVVVLSVIAATFSWEFYCRSIGYGPTLNDNEDLWTTTRRRVKPESIVIIGDSRGWFDLDLDELQKGLGKRPVQLAMGGGCAYPVLADLANDENFHGTIICSVVPRLFVAPPGTPPMARAEKAVRRSHTQTLAQRASQYLAMPLEEHVAFLKQEELTLDNLLKRLPIPNRPGALVPPRLPPYFGTLDRERRARMIEECARPGKLQSMIQQIWLPLFTPPPPPTYIPQDEFVKKWVRRLSNAFMTSPLPCKNSAPAAAKSSLSAFPTAAIWEETGRSRDAAHRDLGPSDQRHRGSRNLLRRFSRTVGLYLSRMVASFRRRFRRIQ